VRRRIARWIILVACLLTAALSLIVVAAGLKQVAKNRLVLADMQDRVTAIEAFQSREARLPSVDELASISQALPVRYFDYDYQLDTTADGGVDSGYPRGWPASGGWVLWFWRGEWAEYYSSWDRHYTLVDQLSWWAFSWPGSIGFAIAAGLLLLSRLPLLRGAKQV
jgi:hypothetical protein